MKFGTRRILIGWMLVGFAAAIAGVRHAHIAPPSAYAAAQAPSTSLPTIPPAGWAQNDTHGTVPGNPTFTVAQMHRLYSALQTFRQRNDGALPNAQAGHSLVGDVGTHAKEYGIATMADLSALLRNPDTRYADSQAGVPHPENLFPYIMPVTRPDGTARSGPKQAGTRDVWAYTDIYFHRNIRNFKNKAATENPVGFYLVLWDDGQVQKVPYQDVRFAQPEARAMGSFTKTLVFPGEAGAPSTTLRYTEYNQWIHDHI